MLEQSSKHKNVLDALLRIEIGSYKQIIVFMNTPYMLACKTFSFLPD